MQPANWFKAITENITESIIIVDSEGTIVKANLSARQLLGMKTDGAGDNNIKNLIHDEAFVNDIETKADGVIRNIRIGGNHFTASKHRVTEEGCKMTLVVLRDITVKDQMEKEMSEIKANLGMIESLMDAFNEWAIVTDEKGIITMMTKAYREFCGCEDPVGKHVEDVIENTRMNQVLETGEAEIGGFQEIRGNKMVAMRMPLKVNGKIIGSVGKVVFKDISDFHSMSNKLNSLEKEIEFYKNELVDERTAKYSIENIVGESESSRNVKSMIIKVAKTDSNILIIGESGTGKELTAHAIHNESKRRTGPIIMVNCGAIPANLLESELFGYEEGAFTGAKKGGKKGKFQQANGGTIFLDEIGDMPLEMQVKLLRVIQERHVEKVGGSGPEEIDVRIVAATNRNLEKKVKEEEFREDLYYRLNVVKIELPSLRERKEDIPAIANSLRLKISERTGIYVEGITKEAMDCLMDYDWPGNIRELENIIERSIILLDSDIMVKLNHLPEHLTKHTKFKKFYGGGRQLKNIVQEIEKDVILECLQRNKWNKNKTSQILGISRAGLYGKIEEYGLVEDSDLQ